MTIKDDGLGRHFVYGYDENDRLKTIAGPNIAIAIGYDDSDNRRTFDSPGANTTFDYEEANRMKKRTDIINQKQFETTFEYDERDNLKRINYPSGRSICYGFDSANRVEFANGCNQPVYAEHVAHHPSGAISGYDAGNGTWESISFDVRARPKHLESFKAINSQVMDLTYDYDEVGNVKTLDEGVQGHSSTFGYDELDRLTTVTGYGAATFDRHAGEPAAQDRRWKHGDLRLRLPEDAAEFVDRSDGHRTRLLRLRQRRQHDQRPHGCDVRIQRVQHDDEGHNARGRSDDVRLRRRQPADDQSNTAGTEYYIRSANGELLAEYRATAGDPELVREYIYLGGRLLASYARGTPPPPALSVTLTSPTANQTFSIGGSGAVVTLQAAVTVPSGAAVQRVEYYQGQTFVGSSTAAPYTVTWNSLPLPPGAVSFSARVVTSDGRSSTSPAVPIALTALPTPESSPQDEPSGNPPPLALIEATTLKDRRFR